MATPNIEYSEITTNPVYANAVANWLIDYQNENGNGLSKPPRSHTEYQGVYALCNDELVGGLTFYVNNDWVFLDSGYVLESYRNNGIYKHIVRHIESVVREKGLSGVWLSTYEFEAPHIYEALGYTKGNVLRDMPRGNTSIDYYKHLGE